MTNTIKGIGSGGVWSIQARVILSPGHLLFSHLSCRLGEEGSMQVAPDAVLFQTRVP